jgi:hypothetical protein
MPCPVHHFAAVLHCPYCAAAAGGFVSGFSDYVPRLVTGAKRMHAQGGLVLAKADRPEAEEIRFAGLQLRAIYQWLVRRPPTLTQAQQAWNVMPQGARDQLVLAGWQGLGGMGGSFAANQVLMFGLSFFAGRIVAARPQLRPLLLLRQPAGIAAGLVLNMLALQGQFQQLITRQRRIFSDFPGTEEAYKDVLKKSV